MLFIGWDPHISHDQQQDRFPRVGSVLHRSCTPSHEGRGESTVDDLSVDDLSVDHKLSGM